MLATFFERLKTEATEPLKSALVLGRQYATQELVTGIRVVVDVELGENRETIGPPFVQGRNLKSPAAENGREHAKYSRLIPCWALVMARATKPGASSFDDLDVCNALVDKFLWAADCAARSAEPYIPFAPGAGGLLRPESEASDDPAIGFVESGKRYLLRFTLTRGVVDRRIEVGTVSGVENTVTLSTWS